MVFSLESSIMKFIQKIMWNVILEFALKINLIILNTVHTMFNYTIHKLNNIYNSIYNIHNRGEYKLVKQW